MKRYNKRSNSKRFKRIHKKDRKKNVRFGRADHDDQNHDHHNDLYFGMNVKSAASFLVGLLGASVAYASSGSSAADGPSTTSSSLSLSLSSSSSSSSNVINLDSLARVGNQLYETTRFINGDTTMSATQKRSVATNMMARAAKGTVEAVKMWDDITTNLPQEMAGFDPVKQGNTFSGGLINSVGHGLNIMIKVVDKDTDLVVETQKQLASKTSREITRLQKTLVREQNQVTAKIWAKTVGPVMIKFIRAVYRAKTGKSDMTSDMYDAIENIQCTSQSECYSVFLGLLQKAVENEYVPTKMDDIISGYEINTLTSSVTKFFGADSFLASVVGAVTEGTLHLTNEVSKQLLVLNYDCYNRYYELIELMYMFHSLTHDLRGAAMTSSENVSKTMKTRIEEFKSSLLKAEVGVVPTLIRDIGKDIFDKTYEHVKNKIENVITDTSNQTTKLIEKISESREEGVILQVGDLAQKIITGGYYTADDQQELMQLHTSQTNYYITNLVTNIQDVTKEVSSEYIQSLKPSDEYVQKECGEMINWTAIKGNYWPHMNSIAGPVQLACLGGVNQARNMLDTLDEVSKTSIDNLFIEIKSSARKIDNEGKRIAFIHNSEISTEKNIALKVASDKIDQTTKGIVSITKGVVDFVSNPISFDAAFVSAPF